MTNRTIPLLGLSAMLLLPATGAMAEEALFPGAAPVSISELDQLRARGAEEAPELLAILENNTADLDHVTSNNGISGTAFANSTGWITVIQNTGNNVIIQSMTKVNVNIF